MSEKKSIPLDEAFEQMLISAERYAFGRRTYIVGCTTDYITPLLPELSEWCLGVLRDDLQSQVEMAKRLGNYNHFGHICDQQDWLALYEKVRAEIERRKGT